MAEGVHQTVPELLSLARRMVRDLLPGQKLEEKNLMRLSRKLVTRMTPAEKEHFGNAFTPQWLSAELLQRWLLYDYAEHAGDVVVPQLSLDQRREAVAYDLSHRRDLIRSLISLLFQKW